MLRCHLFEVNGKDFACIASDLEHIEVHSLSYVDFQVLNPVQLQLDSLIWDDGVIIQYGVKGQKHVVLFLEMINQLFLCHDLAFQR